MSLEKNPLGVLLLSSHCSLASGAGRETVVFLLVDYLFTCIFCLLAAVRIEKVCTS